MWGHQRSALLFTLQSAPKRFMPTFCRRIFSSCRNAGNISETACSFATADLFDCGFQSVCLIDSDSPTVPALAYKQAVKKLSAPGDRVVLGPTEDGGYYLIGLKQPSSILFERIDWSTERVFEQTLQRAEEIGVSVESLPIGFDVDDRASLERLDNELFTTGAGKDVAPHTRRFLATLRDKIPLRRP